jgi:hypothetical protein
MSIEQFEQILSEVELELSQRRAPILARLAKGKAETELKEIFTNIIVPRELFSLYKWKGGTVTENVAIGECWLFKMGALISPEKALKLYERRVNKDEYWTEGMFPIFESLGGDYYLLDINESSPTCGMLFFYSRSAVDFETIISKYDSLQTLFATILECFRREAYYYDNDNTLGFDAKLERNINMAFNRKSAYWVLFR